MATANTTVHQLRSDNPPTTLTTASSTGSDVVSSQVIDALTIGSIDTITASVSLGMANLFQHQMNHASRLDSIAEAFLGKMLKRVVGQDPVEAVSTSKLFKGGSDTGIGSLLAQLSSGQIGGKISQSTSGDLMSEINKLDSVIASMQGLVTGIVAILQQTLMNGVQSIPTSTGFKKITDPSTVPLPSTPKPLAASTSVSLTMPKPTVPPPPPPFPKPSDHYNPPYWPSSPDRTTYPKVTIRY